MRNTERKCDNFHGIEINKIVIGSIIHPRISRSDAFDVLLSYVYSIEGYIILNLIHSSIKLCPLLYKNLHGYNVVYFYK